MVIYKKLKRPIAMTPRRPEVRIRELVHSGASIITDGILGYYTAKVQIKILGTWVTIWSETCDCYDNDTCDYIKNCAEEVIDALTEKI